MKTIVFPSNKDVRQGDPISPPVFIIAMKYLSKRLDIHLASNTSMYFHTKGGILITHLSFAYYVIIIYTEGFNNIKKLCNLFKIFELESRLKINKGKSFLLSLLIGPIIKLLKFQTSLVLIRKIYSFPIWGLLF